MDPLRTFPLPIRSFPIPSMDLSPDWTEDTIGCRDLRFRPSIHYGMFRKVITVRLGSVGRVYKEAGAVVGESVSGSAS